jgi:hypothetical protein
LCSDNFNEKKSILYIFVGKRIFIIKVAGYDIIRSLLTIFVATENKGRKWTQMNNERKLYTN